MPGAGVGVGACMVHHHKHLTNRERNKTHDEASGRRCAGLEHKRDNESLEGGGLPDRVLPGFCQENRFVVAASQHMSRLSAVTKPNDNLPRNCLLKPAGEEPHISHELLLASDNPSPRFLVDEHATGRRTWGGREIGRAHV